MTVPSLNRTISFRFTTEEYDQLRIACCATGVPNVSELARAAIKLLLENPLRIVEIGVDARVSELVNLIDRLTIEIERFNQKEFERRGLNDKRMLGEPAPEGDLP